MFRDKLAELICIQSVPQTRRRFMHHLVGLQPDISPPEHWIRDLSPSLSVPSKSRAAGGAIASSSASASASAAAAAASAAASHAQSSAAAGPALSSSSWYQQGLSTAGTSSRLRPLERGDDLPLINVIEINGGWDHERRARAAAGRSTGGSSSGRRREGTPRS